ncbi:MAG TPA: response regulator [Verrucomicrobiae bacterium]|jgi:CheY-like chemotaxis protein|nr:response regulator [Verrucomicrobiae bacterium]
MNEPIILIVEDNAANQLLVSAVLDQEGYRLELAAGAVEAREMIDRGLPNLILMDVHLPGIDGLTFTRQLKADPVTAHIPVVALTALAMSGDRERAIDAGCIGYISKPINTRTFAADVRGYLSAKL